MYLKIGTHQRGAFYNFRVVHNMYVMPVLFKGNVLLHFLNQVCASGRPVQALFLLVSLLLSMLCVFVCVCVCVCLCVRACVRVCLSAYVVYECFCT